MNIMELKEKPIQQLNQIAKDLSVEGHGGLKRQQLIFEILKAQIEIDGNVSRGPAERGQDHRRSTRRDRPFGGANVQQFLVDPGNGAAKASPAAEIAAIARTLAVGALRYFMLRFTRNRVIAFDFDEVLSFEGETGPYVQYSVVRATNILRKLQERDGMAPEQVAEDLPLTDWADQYALAATVYEALTGVGGGVLGRYGIASLGAVSSVLVFLRRPLKRVRSLLLDPASRTSAALACHLVGAAAKGQQMVVLRNDRLKWLTCCRECKSL